MLGLILTWLITAISFIIISKLPIGVEIDSFGKALMTAAVFGILNALLLPLLTFFTLPFIILSLGLFFFVLNSIIFGISAAIVPGFRLRYGFWSSTIGSIALAIVNSILSFLIPPLI
ncbi:MAG: phage holin family protein [Richelia sp. RM2_1_2]|nr:phage holin family protein [Richelia sp. SM1_7_0]NJN07738.1 phage holin family protein [Richelia sp. RM1_1_1]NJO27311.1 phage holin family protein [Richelia sp. SL_2_1]NJO59466.1 phage holin family protein [Richelia sp. RM2_1_2]NJS16278.1 phage holin family protein [Nostocaceae cyanobacterium CSU_2_110]